MEELLDDLLIGSRAKEIFGSFYQQTFQVTSQDFSNLLLQVSQEFGAEIEGIEYYFTSETNIMDEFDVIDPEQLTWDMFKNRLKNFLIKVLGVSFDEERFTEMSTENFAEEVFLLVSENIFHMFLFEIASKIEEKIEKVKETETGKSWISQYLVEYREELLKIFNKYSNDKSTIEGNNLKVILLTFLKMIRIPIEEKDLFLFDRMVENRFKQMISPNQIKYLRLTFNQFISFCEEWATKEVISQMSFESNLESTLKEMNHLKANHESSLLKPILEELIYGLKSLRRSYQKKPQNMHNGFIESKLKALKEIFNFYAKQIKMLGSKPTFDEITDHQSLLNISKFTKFCNDFWISKKENKDHLNVQQVTQAFLAGNDCSRSMSYSQFLEAVDRLAEMYYNEQFDQSNQTSYARLRIAEKRKLFYEFLKLDNRNEYMQRAKGFGLPFSKEEAGFRIPDYDLSKKYKFKDMSSKKEKIAEWKKTKNSVSTELMNHKPPPAPNPARLAAVKNSLLQRKDRVTWDLLKGAQQSTLISKEDLSSLFTEADIKEIMSSSRGGYK